MKTLGECCSEAVASYLQAYDLRLGQINRTILGQIIDSQVAEHWQPKAERKPRKQREPFMPPLPAEVEAYSISIGWPLNGVSWCEGYQTKGWCTSGTAKMRDWKAAVRKWKAEGWQTAKRPAKGLETPKEAIPEPAGWYAWTQTNLPNCIWLDKPWQEWPQDAQKHVVKEMHA